MQQPQQFLSAEDVASVLASSGCLSTVLEHAAARGSPDLLTALLHRLKSDWAAAAGTSDTSAIIAAFLTASDKGHRGCLELLLDPLNTPPALEGQLLAARGTDGRSALMKAAARGHHECVQLLLSHSPLTQVAAGAAAATPPGPEAGLTWLTGVCKPGVGSNALAFAAQGGHLRSMQLLLQHDPESQMANEDTACYTLRGALGAACSAATGAAGQGRPEATRRVDCLTLLLTHCPDVATEGRRRGKGSEVDCTLFFTLALLSGAYAGSATLRQDHDYQLAVAKCADTFLSKGALLDISIAEPYENEFRSVIRGMASRALIPVSPGEAAGGPEVTAAAFAATRRKQERAAVAGLQFKPVHDSWLGCWCSELYARYQEWSKLGLPCIPFCHSGKGYSMLQACEAGEGVGKALCTLPLPDAAKAAGAGSCAVTCAADRAYRACLALLAARRPSDRQLDRALLALCTSVSRLDPAVEHARIQSLTKCAACLVARGAFFRPQQADKEPVAVLRSILRDMASKALANEAARTLAKTQPKV